MNTKTRVAVLEALSAEREVTHARALNEVKENLERRLEGMNHWREEEIADKLLYLRSDTYEKSETLHRGEREVLSARVAVLEVRITQVATVGAILMLLMPFLTLIAAHYLLK